MANWYKISQEKEDEEGLVLTKDVPRTFEDRNLLNAKIKMFKNVVMILSKLARGAYQNMPEAKKILLTIADDKTTSSYPRIKALLMEAHKIALDNYTKFGEICGAARDKFHDEINIMEVKRNTFCTETLPGQMKARFEHGKEKSDSS